MSNVQTPTEASGEATTATQAPSCPTVERIRALMVRKGWTATQTAAYLGAPTGTLGNWLQGTRRPPSTVARLVDVLGRVEAFYPEFHRGLIPAGKASKTNE